MMMSVSYLPNSVSVSRTQLNHHPTPTIECVEASSASVTTVHAVAWRRSLVPSIIVIKPRSDLCWQCQQNSTTIMPTANSSEAEKSSTIDSALKLRSRQPSIVLLNTSGSGSSRGDFTSPYAMNVRRVFEPTSLATANFLLHLWHLALLPTQRI